LVQQFVARDRSIRIEHHEFEDLELLSREFHGFPASSNLHSIEIHMYLSKPNSVGIGEKLGVPVACRHQD
jgi:hypothetical protein